MNRSMATSDHETISWKSSRRWSLLVAMASCIHRGCRLLRVHGSGLEAGGSRMRDILHSASGRDAYQYVGNKERRFETFASCPSQFLGSFDCHAMQVDSKSRK